MSSAAPDVAVLMAVYDQVDPVHLAEALASVTTQTLVPREIIVVADGPLTSEQEDVLEKFEGAQQSVFQRLSLPTRQGAGPARQRGLDAATSEWVAVADADDISLPERLERQVTAASTLQVDVLAAAMEEFDDQDGRVLGVRAFPEGHDDLRRLMRTVNPINQPAVFCRRQAVIAAGGYRDLPMLEDYDLWARMMGNGARFGNVSDVLVRFRGGAQAHRRRTSKAAFVSEYRLQRALVAAGVIGRARAVHNWVIRSLYRLLPPWVGKLAYRQLFLRSAGDGSPERPEYDRFQDMRESRAPIAEQLGLQALRTSGIPSGREKGLSILDVGSGYGDTAIALAQRGAHVVGLEPARELHDHAVRRASELGLDNVRFELGGVEQLRSEQQFDLVLLDNVYEHLPDGPAALAPISRSLRDGGVLYLLVPNRLWPVEAHYRLFGLGWLPLGLANIYLRLSGRGTDYEDASYAPTYWGLRRALQANGDFDFTFTLPAVRTATVAGSPTHYRVGMALIARFPVLWAVSKALLVVAVRRPRIQSSPSENADSRS